MSSTTGSTSTSTGPNPSVDALVRHGVDPERPYVLFVGRITRQKGIIHLVNAIPSIDPALQVVLCAGAPDTREIGEEMTERVAEVSARPRRRHLDPGDAARGRRHRALLARRGLLLPVGVRAVRHHQPRGDGLRDGRRRVGRRRHPGGGRAGRDRPARRSRAPAGDVRPGRSRRVLARPRRRDQPGRPRPRAARASSGWRGASASRTTSAGRRSRRRRWTSTARWSVADGWPRSRS